ncbi:MAG: hypothetical protein LBR70_01820 [Lactobacillaceae bacterium]|jgi:hypothetical protein|nr:hypothetical protein [Lactobacillaceae bacterium]
MTKDKKESKVKEVVSYCGTRFLSGLGFATTAMAAASPFLNIPKENLTATAAGLFAISAVANYFADKIEHKEKPSWLKKAQQTALLASMCGFAIATQSLEIVTDKQNIEDAGKNLYKPATVAMGKLNDPELEKYYASLSNNVNMEDLMKIAMKTSAKDLKEDKSNLGMMIYKHSEARCS